MKIKMTHETTWYHIDNIDTLDTPALIVFLSRVKSNILKITQSIDSIERLRPHIKTHKTKEVCELLQDAGIQKFKCATIAETELLASVGAKDVLLAYQPVEVKLLRLMKIIQEYPTTHFSCLVDSIFYAKKMSDIASTNDLTLSVYVDLNLGMNRTGILPEHAFELCTALQKLPNLKLEGFHIYDGNIRDIEVETRKNNCDSAFKIVEELMVKMGDSSLKIVAGGTPTFPIHSQRKDVDCSPGTFVFWDKGYQESYPEQNFEPAALVISRVISLPDKDKICLDLGHKSIAAENELSRRVHFLNAPNAIFLGQSEEHLVLQVPENHHYKIGDVFYGLPIHICPTVALYERANVVENGELTGEEWQITARNRKINY